MKSINPANGELLAEYDQMNDDEIFTIIDKADSAQIEWKKRSFDERANILRNAADILKEKKDELAKLMALEMGKPLAGGQAEAEKCAWVCEYFADNAEKFLSNETIESDASKSYVAFEPFGTIFAIMPWNYPFWQLFRFAAPSLMAGNAGILSHAPNVCGCALEIESILHQAGIPKDLFRSVLCDNEQSSKIIENDSIAAVTLTGSVGAGKAVGKKAGSVLKKCVLELGGSDPYVVLKDADVAKAAETCVTSRMINNGQSCIAAKRFIAVEGIYDEFVEHVLKLMKQKKMGDPQDDDTDLGPMARIDLRDQLHQQVERSIEAGAKCVLGGEIPQQGGAWYPATVLTEVKKGMPAYEEELFGPAASIIKVKDEDEALAIANDTVYGLGAAVFSKDVERAEEIAAKKLQAGCCFVNAYVRSDPRLPFGGIKESGYGRELSEFGIREFVNVKTVYIS